MNMLLIDTSSEYLCAVLIKKDKPVSSYIRSQQRAHARRLLPVVEKLLADNSLDLKDLNCIGVCRGPGSFTGLRIGLAAVKGLSLAADIPAVAFTSLDVLAANAEKVKPAYPQICVLTDAKRKQVYAALYCRSPRSSQIKRKGKYFLGKAEDFLAGLKGEVLFIGNGAGLYSDVINSCSGIKARIAPRKFWRPYAEGLAAAGEKEYRARRLVDAGRLSALYLYRDSCAVRKKTKK